MSIPTSCCFAATLNVDVSAWSSGRHARSFCRAPTKWAMPVFAAETVFVRWMLPFGCPIHRIFGTNSVRIAPKRVQRLISLSHHLRSQHRLPSFQIWQRSSSNPSMFHYQQIGQPTGRPKYKIITFHWMLSVSRHWSKTSLKIRRWVQWMFCPMWAVTPAYGLASASYRWWNW